MPVWCVSVRNTRGSISTQLEDCLNLLPSLCQGQCIWNLTCYTDRRISNNLIASLFCCLSFKVTIYKTSITQSVHLPPPFKGHCIQDLSYRVCTLFVLSLSRSLYIQPQLHSLSFCPLFVRSLYIKPLLHSLNSCPLFVKVIIYKTLVTVFTLILSLSKSLCIRP